MPRLKVSFNPRTHIGCDFAASLFCTAPKSFNPRTHIGCDQPPTAYFYDYLGFNPRTHIGCDSITFLNIAPKVGFNPRTHIGCDRELLAKLGLRLFQSTHPHRVRPTKLTTLSLFHGFNPRTHIGCDYANDGLIKFRVSFNPRTHIGCDGSKCKMYFPVCVSIHAPT